MGRRAIGPYDSQANESLQAQRRAVRGTLPNDMIPLSNTFSYFSASVPMNEEDLKEHLEEPIAALPPAVASLLPNLSIMLVPYLERANGKQLAPGERRGIRDRRVGFERRPRRGRRRRVWRNRQRARHRLRACGDRGSRRIRCRDCGAEARGRVRRRTRRPKAHRQRREAERPSGVSLATSGMTAWPPAILHEEQSTCPTTGVALQCLRWQVTRGAKG
jgi:hypothetical protein